MAFEWTCPVCKETIRVCDGRDISEHELFCEKFNEFSTQIASGKKKVKVRLDENTTISYKKG